MKPILLHSCCAICSGYPIRALQEAGYEPVVYFYNPNILPEQEYLKRLEAQRTLCEYYDCKLIVGEYEPERFLELVEGLENEPEGGVRCEKCFKLRLSETARMAKSLGIETFTTSLPISPYKDFDKIRAIGDEVAKSHCHAEFISASSTDESCENRPSGRFRNKFGMTEGLNFKAIDFKKNDGFLKTNKLSKELNLYRQNYCGCSFVK